MENLHFCFHPSISPEERSNLLPKVHELLSDPENRVGVRAGGRREIWMNSEEMTPSLVVKVNYSRTWTRRLKQLFRGSKSRMEFDSYRALEEVGLPIPRVLAWGTFGVSRWIASGCLLVSYRLLGASTLLQRLQDPGLDVDAVVGPLSELLRALQRAGFEHHDLRGRNILVTTENVPRYFLLDAREIRPEVKGSKQTVEESVGKLLGYSLAQDVDASRIKILKENLRRNLDLDEDFLESSTERYRLYAEARLKRKGHL
ncbi:MAG: lipopolysaccharide kinase InaA family protein [Planctomycetota bacterium]|nr:lipopolysaccharide kinase InaA family protein [Planctomycetota bacterium]